LTDQPMPGKPMPVSIHRRRLAAFAAAVERHHVVPRLYIAALCLVYLMWNIWTARTIYDFTVMPLALCLLRPSDLRPILASPIFILAGLYFAALGLAEFAAPGASALAIAKHVMYALQVLSFLAITALLMRRDPEFPKTLFLCLAGAAAVAAAVNIAAFLHQHPHGLLSQQLNGVPGIAMYYNQNYIGIVNAVACAGCFALIAGQRLSRPQLMATLAATLVLLATVTLIMSRGSLMATIAAGFVAFVLSGGQRGRQLMLGVLAAALLLLALATPLVLSAVSRGDSFRLSLWRFYLDMAAERPWLGYGLSFNTQIVLPDGLPILQPHNMMLATLIRGGLVSVAALTAMLATAAYHALRNHKSEGGLFAPVLLAAALVATCVDFEIVATPLGWPWLLLWLPIGLSLGGEVTAGGSGQVGR
jgi:O-antigen ligase